MPLHKSSLSLPFINIECLNRDAPLFSTRTLTANSKHTHLKKKMLFSRVLFEGYFNPSLSSARLRLATAYPSSPRLQGVHPSLPDSASPLPTPALLAPRACTHPCPTPPRHCLPRLSPQGVKYRVYTCVALEETLLSTV